MFNVNYKNTRTTLMTSSSAFIVDFEQMNVSWVYILYFIELSSSLV